MKSYSHNILVAEDDPTISLVVAIILRKLGHKVEVVDDGREAIVAFDARPDHYDIVFTDHDMPEVSGLEFIDHLRAKNFGGRVIVMSGSLSDDLMHAYLAKRVDKILQKPFTLEMLSTSLGELIQQWREEGTGGK
ncbi:MAG TPA: response regulator [Chthoniobacteraceae bacterium]|nr:response regulator [Chthoniobacteraceae bacterium]